MIVGGRGREEVCKLFQKDTFLLNYDKKKNNNKNKNNNMIIVLINDFTFNSSKEN